MEPQVAQILAALEINVRCDVTHVNRTLFFGLGSSTTTDSVEEEEEEDEEEEEEEEEMVEVAEEAAARFGGSGEGGKRGGDSGEVGENEVIAGIGIGTPRTPDGTFDDKGIALI